MDQSGLQFENFMESLPLSLRQLLWSQLDDKSNCCISMVLLVVTGKKPKANIKNRVYSMLDQS